MPIYNGELLVHWPPGTGLWAADILNAEKYMGLEDWVCHGHLEQIRAGRQRGHAWDEPYEWTVEISIDEGIAIAQAITYENYRVDVKPKSSNIYEPGVRKIRKLS